MTELRGKLRENVVLAPLSWLRVGGPTERLFQPADQEDLQTFLAATPTDVPVLPMGVASNMLIRDGGWPGVVVRFGGPLAKIEVEDTTLIAGAGALDQRVAQVAAKAGLAGIEFMIGIPGTIGGAVRMNAGAFGGETKDRLIWVDALDRRGGLHRLSNKDLGFTYRSSELPADWIALRAAFALEAGDVQQITSRMEKIKAEREAAQPIRVATGGSTFKNPPGHSAWRLIDEAGCRGLTIGGAMVSEKHCNFLINRGDAKAEDLERLGEVVRERVLAKTNTRLEWEIKRLGIPLTQPATDGVAS